MQDPRWLETIDSEIENIIPNSEISIDLNNTIHVELIITIDASNSNVDVDMTMQLVEDILEDQFDTISSDSKFFLFFFV